MGSKHRKLITAALLAASAGLWGAAFAAPEFGVEPDKVSDCRGLGILAGVALIVWVMVGPRVRRIEERLDAQDQVWADFRGGQDAAHGHGPGDLRPVSGRHVS